MRECAYVRLVEKSSRPSSRPSAWNAASRPRVSISSTFWMLVTFGVTVTLVCEYSASLVSSKNAVSRKLPSSSCALARELGRPRALGLQVRIVVDDDVRRDRALIELGDRRHAHGAPERRLDAPVARELARERELGRHIGLGARRRSRASPWRCRPRRSSPPSARPARRASRAIAARTPKCLARRRSRARCRRGTPRRASSAHPQASRRRSRRAFAAGSRRPERRDRGCGRHRQPGGASRAARARSNPCRSDPRCARRRLRRPRAAPRSATARGRGRSRTRSRRPRSSRRPRARSSARARASSGAGRRPSARSPPASPCSGGRRR